MKRYMYSLGAVMLLAGAVPAMAQVYYGPGPTLPLHWYVDGGYSVTTGQTTNYLDNGWNIGGGVQWRPSPGPLSLRVDGSFSRYDATNQLLADGAQANQTYINNGWGDIFSLDLDGVFDIPLGGGVKAYLMAGGGGAYRRINFTQTVGFLAIAATAGRVSAHRASRRATCWSITRPPPVGNGMPVRASIFRSAETVWFIEKRYTQMQTPRPDRSSRFGLGSASDRGHSR